MARQEDRVVLTLAGESNSSSGLFGSGTMRGNSFPHPVALFFHLCFRVAAALTYLFCGWFSGNFITSFVCVVILLSMDFWTTKNITGRLLAGLRWWNYVDEDGTSHWVYESRSQLTEEQEAASRAPPLSPGEVRIFWGGLVGSMAVWGFFFIASVFTLNLRWLMVVLVALSLTGANLYGYLRCRLGAKKPIGDAAKTYLMGTAMRGLITRFTKGASQDDNAARR